jgi:hypothetical protein
VVSVRPALYKGCSANGRSDQARVSWPKRSTYNHARAVQSFIGGDKPDIFWLFLRHRIRDFVWEGLKVGKPFHFLLGASPLVQDGAKLAVLLGAVITTSIFMAIIYQLPLIGNSLLTSVSSHEGATRQRTWFSMWNLPSDPPHHL